MRGTRVSYLDEQQPLEGYLAAPDSARDLPGVLSAWIRTRDYCSNTGGSPLIRFHFRLTPTSTRFAILMNGMPLFMP